MKRISKKRKSPSRDKYEKANPTVSARIPIPTRDKLLDKLEALGMSLSEALKVLAGELEIKAKPVEEARCEGFQQGYKTAREKYLVSYPCAKCSKLIMVNTANEKTAIQNFMKEAGWGHKNCDQV